MIRAISDQDYDKELKLSEYAFQFTEAEYDWEEAKRKLDKQYILGDFEDYKLLA
ncbi:GNAT family N-acetyltransferase [Metabacillus sediminilitoris]|uniref:GNAT family N-acetyltransferase n=1 Tax=Metabacillus sediminilitoris TaxID=2567941 RepID=UPI0012D75249|nr:GNAT family N-acetyltransferase [Metabacillus sediminilitoris]QGQ46981.1 hypothetical protein GMB29_18080 [Metabacillus sediminilitoris]